VLAIVELVLGPMPPVIYDSAVHRPFAVEGAKFFAVHMWRQARSADEVMYTACHSGLGLLRNCVLGAFTALIVLFRVACYQRKLSDVLSGLLKSLKTAVIERTGHVLLLSIR
jgi:hypothetical protein